MAADGNYLVAHFDCCRGAEWGNNELFSGDIGLKQGNVGSWIGTNDSGSQRCAVIKREVQGAAVLDHVVVRQDVAGFVYHKAGAGFTKRLTDPYRV